MKVVCAWCERQGRIAVLREKAPDQSGVSHGICDDHALLLLAEIRRKDFPSRIAGETPMATAPTRRLDFPRPMPSAGAAPGRSGGVNA